MEAMLNAAFLKVVNLSITGSYVILAVLAARLLLRRAPKKFSYALWAAVGFRLLSPVSFRAAFSLLSPLHLEAETLSPAASAIIYVPSDIGMMRQPAVTTGLPYLNNAVNGSLPAPTNELTSINPMQVWIAVGMALWCLGMIVMAVWAAVSLVRLRLRLRTAVALEGNVRQSEAVRSPFILGLVRPRIYIPFGLEGDTLTYVLAHERCHLRRGDHVARLAAFCILTLHWFNPLVWLAWFLMGRDMEMSCDEAVLRRCADSGVPYSETLLSFAAPRHFSPAPLAFGETAVSSRIKNALNWKAPRRWVTALAAAVCIAAVAVCAANPAEKPVTAQPLAEGVYVSSRCLYANPLNSAWSGGDTGYRYLVEEKELRMERRMGEGGNMTIPVSDWAWQTFPFTGEAWRDLFWPGGFGAIEELDYDEMLFQPLTEEFFLLRMDGEVWLVETYDINKVGRRIWSVHTLVPEGDMGSAQWQFRPQFSSQYPAFPFSFDFPHDRFSAVCGRGVLVDFDGGQDSGHEMICPAGSRLYWTPSAEDGLMVHEAVVRFTVDLPGGSQCHGSLYFTSEPTEGPGALYTARLVADGLVLEQDEELGGGVIRVAN